jgi:hypothetical protein
MKKQLVKIKALEEIGRQEWPLTDFVNLIANAMQTIPSPYLHTAKINLTLNYEDPELTIYYQREETDEEFNTRKEKDLRRPQEQREYEHSVAEKLRRTCASWIGK